MGQKLVGYTGLSELFKRTSQHRSGRRALWAEGTASAKSWKLGTERKPVWPECSGGGSEWCKIKSERWAGTRPGTSLDFMLIIGQSTQAVLMQGSDPAALLCAHTPHLSCPASRFCPRTSVLTQASSAPTYMRQLMPHGVSFWLRQDGSWQINSSPFHLHMDCSEKKKKKSKPENDLTRLRNQSFFFFLPVSLRCNWHNSAVQV